MVSRQFHFNGFGANMLYFFTLFFVGSICYPNFYYRAITTSIGADAIAVPMFFDVLMT